MVPLGLTRSVVDPQAPSVVHTSALEPAGHALLLHSRARLPGTRQNRAQALWVSQPVARMDGWGEGPRPSQSPSRPCDRPRCAPRGLAWGCRCDYSTAPLGTRRGILDRVPPRQTASPVKPQCTCPQLGHFTVHKPPGPGPVQDVSETHDPPGAPAYFSRPTAPWTALAGSSGSETGER